MYLNGNLVTSKCENNNDCPHRNMQRTRDCNFNKHRCKKDMDDSNEAKSEEVLSLRIKFPTKIPIIIKRYNKELVLPELDKSKFLVPQDITMSQFQTIIRNRLQLDTNHALYLLVNNRSMVSLSRTMAEIYSQHSAPDGFLYITYASQEVFG